MKVKILPFIVRVCLATWLLVSVVQAADYGGYGGAYLQLSINPRATGMGNAYTAVSDDISGIFFNPAAVVQVSRFSVGGAYRDLSLDRSLQQLAILVPVRGEAALGFSAEIASMSNILGRTSRGEPTEELSNLDAAVGITFARRFSRFMSVGGSVRYYHKKLESVSAYSAGFDIGSLVHLAKGDVLPENGLFDLLRFGLVVRNITAKYPWNTVDYWGPLGGRGVDVTDEVPLDVKAGVSALLIKSKLLLAIDSDKERYQSVKVNTGGEYWLVPMFGLRAGLAAGRPTFGVGFKNDFGKVNVGIDIAVEEARNIGGWETIVGFSAGF